MHSGKMLCQTSFSVHKIIFFVGVLFSCLHIDGSHGYITYIAARLPLEGEPVPPGSPWPMPRIWAKHPDLLTIDPTTFSMVTNLRGCDVVDQAIQRYKRIILQDTKLSRNVNLKTIGPVRIEVNETKCDHYPQEGDNEYYEIHVQSSKSTIRARTIWGALQGIETFSQLVHVVDKKYQINVTEIQDWPRFGYRGLLVDTARHYIRVDVLLQILDAMAYNKMNAFHWHIVDDQSFPYVSKKFPELSQKAAYSPLHVYSQTDVSRVIQFARLRGIRVIPEFDTPGHTQSWGKAFPELLTPCWVDEMPYRAVNGLDGHAISENFDPTKNRTYDFLREFWSEIVEVFEDDHVDLGMDEAHYYCWRSSPDIAKFMTEKGYGPDEFYKLEEYYQSRLIDIAKSLGAKMFMYQDPIDHGTQVSHDVIVRTWKGEDKWQGYVHNVTRLGYRTVLSACYYLNYISYGEDWRKYYTCDPQHFGGTKTQKELVIGGEASIWNEYVDNTNILSRLWPRCSAVAERLWSSAEVNNTDDAARRLDQHRCRMLRRGIPADPIRPGYCGDVDVIGSLYSETSTPSPCHTSSAGRPSDSNVIYLYLMSFLGLLVSHST